MNAWSKLAENRIQEAIEAGELDPTMTAGPLDLTDYFALPAEERAGISLLRNAGVLPTEVELLRREAGLEQELATATGERARVIKTQLEELRVTFRMAMERRSRAARQG